MADNPQRSSLSGPLLVEVAVSVAKVTLVVLDVGLPENPPPNQPSVNVPVAATLLTA